MKLKLPKIPQFERGIVWCTVCGASLRTNAYANISKGWPKCCGYTMTIDSPEERLKLKGASNG